MSMPDFGLKEEDHIFHIHPLILYYKGNRAAWSDVRDTLIYTSGKIGIDVATVNVMLPLIEKYYKST